MDIAQLDEDGVITDVVTVSPDDYRTDPRARTVALPENHDMHNRIRSYRFDYMRGCFEPISVLSRTGTDSVEFVDALVDAIALLTAHTRMRMPAKLHRALLKKGIDV